MFLVKTGAIFFINAMAIIICSSFLSTSQAIKFEGLKFKSFLNLDSRDLIVLDQSQLVKYFLIFNFKSLLLFFLYFLDWSEFIRLSFSMLAIWLLIDVIDDRISFKDVDVRKKIKVVKKGFCSEVNDFILLIAFLLLGEFSLSYISSANTQLLYLGLSFLVFVSIFITVLGTSYEQTRYSKIKFSQNLLFFSSILMRLISETVLNGVIDETIIAFLSLIASFTLFVVVMFWKASIKEYDFSKVVVINSIICITMLAVYTLGDL